VLAGCAGDGITQTGCEESTRTFPDMQNCLKMAVDRRYTPRPQYNPDLHLYLVKTDYLAERVRTNQLSDFEGRVELQRLYVALQAQKMAAK
jgi:hypothetical protein